MSLMGWFYRLGSPQNSSSTTTLVTPTDNRYQFERLCSNVSGVSKLAVHCTPQTETVLVSQASNLYEAGCLGGSPAASDVVANDTPQTQTKPATQTISLAVSV